MDEDTTPRQTVGGSASRIDWDAGGIETEMGWSLQATYFEFARNGEGAVAIVPGGARGYQILVAITTEAPSSQLALAHRLAIDKSTMTALIDALETQGLVWRRPDPADRRVRQVIPTDAGRARLAQARIALRAAEGRLMRDLSDAEQLQLRHLLARVALGAAEVASACEAGIAPAPRPGATGSR